VKLPEGKILIPGVVAGLVGRENVIAGTDRGMGFRVHPQIAWAKLKALAEGARLATQQLW
jgi:5-methyltetrahydropteroyltriglutamate--homocysteine methyltransferase